MIVWIIVIIFVLLIGTGLYYASPLSKDELPLINGTMRRNIFGGNKMPSGIDKGTIDGASFVFTSHYGYMKNHGSS